MKGEDETTGCLGQDYIDQFESSVFCGLIEDR